MDEDTLLFLMPVNEHSPPWSYRETRSEGFIELTDERRLRFLLEAIQQFRSR